MNSTNIFPNVNEVREIASVAREKYPLPPEILKELSDLIRETAAFGLSSVKYFLPKNKMEFQEFIVTFLRGNHYGAIFIDVDQPYISINW